MADDIDRRRWQHDLTIRPGGREDWLKPGFWEKEVLRSGMRDATDEEHGTVEAAFFRAGDVLAVYAVFGLMGLVIVSQPPKVLLALAGGLFADFLLAMTLINCGRHLRPRHSPPHRSG